MKTEARIKDLTRRNVSFCRVEFIFLAIWIDLLSSMRKPKFVLDWNVSLLYKIKSISITKKLAYSPEGIVPFPRTNWPIYTINDSPAVDFVGRREQFREHPECAFSEIGVPFEEEKLPKTKQSISYDYRSFYDNKALKIVKRVYKKETYYFSYSFNWTYTIPLSIIYC